MGFPSDFIPRIGSAPRIAHTTRVCRVLAVAISLLAALIAVSPASASAPASFWGATAGGAGKDRPREVFTLDDGSAIVVGTFEGTINLGGTSVTSAGGMDWLIAKTNANGSYAWVTRAGGTGEDQAFGIARAADGSLRVVGHFSGTASFGAAGNVTSAGGHEIAVTKLTAGGAFVWVRRAGGTGNDYAYRVAVLSDGSTQITGSCQNTPTFGSTTLSTSLGAGDLFISRLDADGGFVWTRWIGGSSTWDDLFSMAVLPDGTTAFTGYFGTTATFNNGTVLTARGSSDIVVGKINETGDVLWVQRAGGDADDFGYDIALRTDGSVVVAGYFRGPNAAFGGISVANAGGQDLFVARYLADGTISWVATGGGTGDDLARDVTTLADGSMIIAGTASGTAAFGSQTVTASGADALLVHLSATGTFGWAITRGGAGADAARSTSALDDGTITMVGNYGAAMTLSGTARSHAGDEDLWLERLGTVPTAPAAPSTTVGAGSVTVSIIPGTGDGITDYIVTAVQNGATCTITPPATSCSVTGLTAGTSYTFTVTTRSANGTSEASVASTVTIPDAAAPTAQPVADAPTPAASTAAPGSRISRLAGRIRHAGGIVLTTGPIPTGTTHVRQIVRRSGVRAAWLPARCTVTGTVYRCAIALPPGVWGLSTEARAGDVPLARRSDRVRISAQTSPSAVTG